MVKENLNQLINFITIVLNYGQKYLNQPLNFIRVILKYGQEHLNQPINFISIVLNYVLVSFQSLFFVTIN